MTKISPNYDSSYLRKGLVRIISDYASLPVNDFNADNMQLEFSMFLRDLVAQEFLLCSEIPTININKDSEKWMLSSKDALIAGVLKGIFND